MAAAGGVLSPLELCDVNGDGLSDILIVFTALMNASVMGKHSSSFPFLFLYMSVQTFVCLPYMWEEFLPLQIHRVAFFRVP